MLVAFEVIEIVGVTEVATAPDPIGSFGDGVFNPPPPPKILIPLMGIRASIMEESQTILLLTSTTIKKLIVPDVAPENVANEFKF